jgi:hypothetical protein
MALFKVTITNDVAPGVPRISNALGGKIRLWEKAPIDDKGKTLPPTSAEIELDSATERQLIAEGWEIEPASGSIPAAPAKPKTADIPAEVK